MTKLLIVEDQKPLLDLVKDWLTKDGYMVDCATTGPDALLHLKQYQYDLIKSTPSPRQRVNIRFEDFVLHDL